MTGAQHGEMYKYDCVAWHGKARELGVSCFKWMIWRRRYTNAFLELGVRGSCVVGIVETKRNPTRFDAAAPAHVAWSGDMQVVATFINVTVLQL